MLSPGSGWEELRGIRDVVRAVQEPPRNMTDFSGVAGSPPDLRQCRETRRSGPS